MGKFRNDKVIVVDLEATCWESDPPQGQVTEIIEIGLCNYNVDSGLIEDKTSYIIKPRHSEVSEYCTNLTSITPQMVKGGMPFFDACNKIIKEFGPKTRVWASFGEDKTQFEDNCKLYNVEYPFGIRYINIQTLYSLKHSLSKECGLDTILELHNIIFEGTRHRGCDDAYNTAKILHHCLKE